MCWILYPAYRIQILYQQSHKNDQPATSLRGGVVQTKIKLTIKPHKYWTMLSHTTADILLNKQGKYSFKMEYIIFSEAKDKNSVGFLDENWREQKYLMNGRQLGNNDTKIQGCSYYIKCQNV